MNTIRRFMWRKFRSSVYVRFTLCVLVVWGVAYFAFQKSLYKSSPISNNIHDVADEHLESSQILSFLISGSSYNTNGAGEMGIAYTLGRKEKGEESRRFKENEFNVVVSEHISLNRSLPFVAPSACKSISYPHDLPTTSVVIVFHNEAWSTLLRTVHSVINRSPAHLLQEVILIDDASDQGTRVSQYKQLIAVHLEHLKKSLEEYIIKLGDKVKLHRLQQRSGLIAARIVGSKLAKGEVLTFLDAHVEATPLWLEPLLKRISEKRTTLVTPVIDVIDENNFKYAQTTSNTWGGFTWQLNFRWYTTPLSLNHLKVHNNDIVPLRTPAIAGGLFSIDRKFFNEIGTYDEEMKIWGAENVEISIRVWSCGGSMEIHPCSHVGHVFRKQTPYKFVGGATQVIYSNSKRVAEVWMDEYKEFYYAMLPQAKSVDAGNLTNRRQLRLNLKCKSFEWYLRNIYPECNIPYEYYSLGRIYNAKNGLCLDTGSHLATKNPTTKVCHRFSGNQAWSYTGDLKIRSDEFCLVYTLSKSLVLEKCIKTAGGARWDYNQINKTLTHWQSKLCLKNFHKKLIMEECSADDLSQQWILEKYDGSLYPR